MTEHDKLKNMGLQFSNTCRSSKAPWALRPTESKYRKGYEEELIDFAIIDAYLREDFRKKANRNTSEGFTN